MLKTNPLKRQKTKEKILNRRSFLSQGWNWTILAVVAVLSFPFFRFLQFKVPKLPKRYLVAKTILPGGFLQEHDFVLFEGENGPWAVSRRCTHLGCRLNYLEKEGQLVCPCHHSKFSKVGKRLAGPARNDLTIFVVERVPENDGSGYIVII